MEDQVSSFDNTGLFYKDFGKQTYITQMEFWLSKCCDQRLVVPFEIVVQYVKIQCSFVEHNYWE